MFFFKFVSFKSELTILACFAFKDWSHLFVIWEIPLLQGVSGVCSTSQNQWSFHNLDLFRLPDDLPDDLFMGDLGGGFLFVLYHMH